MLAPKHFLTIKTCLRVGICAIFVGGFAASLEAGLVVASGTITATGLKGNWYQPCGTADVTCPISGTTPNLSVLSVSCPNIPNPNGPQYPNVPTNGNPGAPSLYTLNCGFTYPSNGFNKVGTGGWHSYTSGGVQSYLNNLTSSTNSTNPLSFNLTSDASLVWYDSGEASVSEPYRHPPGDYGYYLTTADTSKTPGITVCVGSNVANCTTATPSLGISKLAFYWGSVDPWNQIGFCQSSGSCVYVYGSDLSGFTFSQTSYGVGPGNIKGAVVYVYNTTLTPWAYITFTSCDKNGNCNPAFEIDNLLYATSGCSSCALFNGALDAPAAPTPEPASAFMLAGGAAVALRRLRRKA